MKTIQLRLFLLAALCGLGLMFSFILIAGNAQFYIIHKSTFVVVLFSTSIFLFYFSALEYNKLVFARLIIENRILHIQAAEAEQQSHKHGVTVISAEIMDIYISCFGILLGSKVIKFNAEGINLKKVDIGNDFINIYYGKGDRNEFIRLFHRTIDDGELQDIMDQFRRETGIIPNIVNY